VRSSERVAAFYFAYLVAIACVRPLSAGRRAQIVLGGAAMCAAIVLGISRADARIRNWAPLASILVGYYLAGRTFVAPMPRVERWLLAWDRRLLGDPTTRFANWPRLVLGYLDTVYMFCFALVPAGFATLAWSGHLDLADRYSTMVVAAELGAFAPLALLQTRPPWALERPARVPDDAVQRAAASFVRHATTGANTLPSGHVAGSLAIACAVIPTMPLAGTVFVFLAGSIALACIVGRYHYIVDVVSGAALALAVWAVVTAAGV